MTDSNHTPTPDTSFEFVEAWFKKAADNARQQGRHNSALLWQDGLKHLQYFKSRADHYEALVSALRDLLSGELCGESWGLPDTEGVCMPTTFGAIRRARKLLANIDGGGSE